MNHWNECIFVSCATAANTTKKKIRNKQQRSLKQRIAERNWNIFISQTLLTGRANDRSTESSNSAVELHQRGPIFPRVHAQKVIISTCCFRDGHKFLFFGIFLIYHWYSQSVFWFWRSRDFCVFVSSIFNRLCIALIFWPVPTRK